jgi:hypothetical protein
MRRQRLDVIHVSRRWWDDVLGLAPVRRRVLDEGWRARV